MKVFPREFFHYRLVIIEGDDRFHLYPAHIAASRILVILPEGQSPTFAAGRTCRFRLESRNRKEPIEFAGEIQPLGGAVYRGHAVQVASVRPSHPLVLSDDLIAVQMAVDAS